MVCPVTGRRVCVRRCVSTRDCDATASSASKCRSFFVDRFQNTVLHTNSRRCAALARRHRRRGVALDALALSRPKYSRRGAPLLIIVEPRLEGVLGLDRLALAILPRLLPSRRRRRQGLAIKQCLHIRLYESDRVAPWVASQRAAALVEKELLVVEDDARDAPWVGARLGQPCVERQSVRAEQVRLCV